MNAGLTLIILIAICISGVQPSPILLVLPCEALKWQGISRASAYPSCNSDVWSE